MHKRQHSYNENSLIYSNRGPGSVQLHNIVNLPIFDHSMQVPYQYKENSLANLSILQPKKLQKGHGRNHSDLLPPPALKRTQFGEFQDCEKMKMCKISNLQYRINKIEEKLNGNSNQAKVSQFSRKEEYRILREKISEDCKIVTEMKLKEVGTVLAELRQKIEKISMNASPISSPKPDRMTKIEPNSQLTTEKVDKFVDKINQINHQLIQSLRKEFKSTLNQLTEKVKTLSTNKQFQQAANPQNQFFKTNRKYSSNSISFIYEQYIRKIQKQSNKQNTQPQLQPQLQAQPQLNKSNSYCLNQITYYIDPEGFLLDENSQYLVNSKYKQIKLSERELKMLKKMKILQS